MDGLARFKHAPCYLISPDPKKKNSKKKEEKKENVIAFLSRGLFELPSATSSTRRVMKLVDAKSGGAPSTASFVTLALLSLGFQVA
jgi:hypothetical protein